MANKTPKGRLTDEGVAYIHKRRAENATYQEIAQELAVCITTVFNAAKGRSRKNRR